MNQQINNFIKDYLLNLYLFHFKLIFHNYFMMIHKINNFIQKYLFNLYLYHIILIFHNYLLMNDEINNYILLNLFNLYLNVFYLVIYILNLNIIYIQNNIHIYHKINNFCFNCQ
jgi:hypothetical protein